MRRTVLDQQENCYQWQQQRGCFSAKKFQLVLSKQSCGSDTVASGLTLTILLVDLTLLAFYADNISKEMWSERPWWGQGQASINIPLFIVYICVNMIWYMVGHLKMWQNLAKTDLRLVWLKSMDIMKTPSVCKFCCLLIAECASSSVAEYWGAVVYRLSSKNNRKFPWCVEGSFHHDTFQVGRHSLSLTVVSIVSKTVKRYVAACSGVCSRVCDSRRLSMPQFCSVEQAPTTA